MLVDKIKYLTFGIIIELITAIFTQTELKHEETFFNQAQQSLSRTGVN